MTKERFGIGEVFGTEPAGDFQSPLREGCAE
jgi:hypothetical protein